MEIAHNLGVESTSTMLMGTGETNAERILAHLMQAGIFDAYSSSLADL